MKLETVVCIKTGFEYYWTAEPRFTKDKKYFVMYDSEQSIQVIDDYGKGIQMDRPLFDAHFEYLSDMREEKLKELGM